MKMILATLTLCLLGSTALATTATYVGDDANGDLDGMIQISDTNAPLSRTAVGEDGVPVTELNGPGATVQTLLYLNFIGEGANQVPAGTSVSSAELQLWYSNDNKNNDITVYRLTKSFDTNTTWGIYGAIGDSGADNQVVNFGSADPVQVTVDVTAVVQSWVSGASTNHGWGFSEEVSNGCEWTSVFANGGGDSGNSINPTLVVEYDDGSVAIITATNAVNVSEGSTNTFNVKLSLQPSASVTVNTAWVSGDTDISVTLGADLTFTTNNWSNYQTVTLSATEDSDWVNGSATLRCSSPEMSDVDITATELDNDTDPSLLLPFSEPFENSGENAVTNGALNGQHGWTGGGTVQTGTVHAGSQALRLQNETAVHAFDGAEANVTVEFHAKFVRGEASQPDAGTAVAIFQINNDGHLVAYSNTTPITLTGTTLTDEWHHFKAQLDYNAQTWELRVDDVLLVDDFAFYSAQSDFTKIAFTSGSEPAFFDAFSVANSEPADDDTDGDGLPDSWENQYGGLSLNPTNTAANGINTVLETYIAGLNPTNATSSFELSNTRNTLEWESISDRIYTVYWTSNLLTGTFQRLEPDITGSPFTDTNHPSAEKCFYKIEVKLD